MTEFTSKKLKKAKRVCFRLREARENAGFSIDDISEKTRLDKKIIVALEDCRFDDLPKGTVYRKQFIKAYLQAVGVNPNSYIWQFTSEEATKAAEYHPTKSVDRKFFQNLPAVLRVASLAVVSIIFIGYLGLQVRRILVPPQLFVHSPTDGLVTDDSAIVVQGATGKEVRIVINGKDIASDTAGQFKEKIDLTPGINTITVSAVKKHGKTTTEVRHVIVRRQQQITISNTSTIATENL
jgi:cytoskeletal protein RodZ